jgi:hypothetical protein
MGESRTPGGIAVVSTVWREGLGQLARAGWVRTRLRSAGVCARHGWDGLRPSLSLEVWAGLQHKAAVAVTTTAGKQTQKPLGMLGRAGKARTGTGTGTGTTQAGKDR